MNVLLTGMRLSELYHSLDHSIAEIGKRDSYNNVYLSEEWEATAADSTCTRLVYWILDWAYPSNVQNIASAFKICLSEYNKAIAKLSSHYNVQEFTKLKERLDFLTDLVRANQKSFESVVEKKTFDAFKKYYKEDHFQTASDVYRRSGSEEAALPNNPVVKLREPDQRERIRNKDVKWVVGEGAEEN